MRNQKSKLRLAQLELDRKFNFKTDLFSSIFLFEHSFRCKNAFENLDFSSYLANWKPLGEKEPAD